FLARIEPQVLEHRDVARAEAVDRVDRVRLVRHAERPDGGTTGEQYREGLRDDPRAQLALRRALRPAEVRREDERRLPFPELVDRRDRGGDPAVVGDGAVGGEWHVEVDAEEHPGPGDVPE